ncbi:MAG: apolipoprotein N-acyltransferase [Candidatus Marinimicrobia bacterium]|jgi:apolipoprotein N-acyltransferase|nr:apolipoprotein N-acyltransferase [Candidatus Neomarinimicrobiota bacterium]MDP6612146.1 apolipoprotein N-acyltransferase [Candidatus Neomarinimicrobiota bacterium]|tara:strand:- start:14503 stop:15999 length:1497 start_codon:yes stop_codon:yes gene_type:complete
MKKILERSPFQLAMISGILVGCAYPPLPGVTAWFGFLPIIHIWQTQSPKESARWSFFSSIVANLISLYWIGLNSGAGVVAVLLSLFGAVLYLGAIWAGLGWLVAKIERRTGNSLSIIPFLWVTMEWIRSFGPLGFPWANLATTQTVFLPVIQMVDITGSEGIGFWLLLVNVVLYITLQSEGNRKKMLLCLLVLFLLPWVIGLLRLPAYEFDEETPHREVAVLQPNINPNQKWEASFRSRLFEIMDSLNAEAMSMDPDLVLWPEAALPVYMRVSSKRQDYEWLVIEKGIPILMGTVDFKRDSTGRRVYNSSIYISLEGNKIYHKKFLVPFAEYIPMSENFPDLKKLNFGQASFTAGKEFTTFHLDSILFSNMICYESSHPAVARGFVQNGARFLTIEANDAWLRNSSGVRQHFELARLRAVELRTGIVRSANTGISGLIHPSGKVENKVLFGDQGVFKGKVSLNRGLTFYARYGSVFAQMCFILTLIQFIWLLRRSKHY